MELLTSEQANILANTYLKLAEMVADYRFDNWNTLSGPLKDQLESMRQKMTSQGQEMLAQSTVLVMNDITESLAELQTITNAFQNTLKTIHNINKGIMIIASVLSLGDAIINHNIKAIPDSLKNIADFLK